MRHSSRLLIAIMGLLVTGCASSPSDDLSPFGTSVRHAMESQTYREGDQAPPLNGERAARVMEAYRNQEATGAAPRDMVPVL